MLDILVWVAAICIPVSYILQIISNYKHKETRDINILGLFVADYAYLVYQLIPRGERVRSLDSNLTQKQTDKLAELVLKSPIIEQLTAEINFGKLIHDLSLSRKQRAEELINTLKDYQKEIQN